MSSRESDERVMQRLAAGDESALDELMRRWEGPIWCFIDRMCGRLGSTDDVYQEAWTRVFLYRGRYKPIMQFRPYLFAIAMNCCRTALSRGRASRRFAAPLADAPDPPTAPDPPPIDAAAASEQSELLHLAIARLPEAQRAVVLLHLLFDSDYNHIASVLKRSAGTVRSNMHHALRNLRAYLTRVSVNEPESQVDHERLDQRTT